MLRRIGGGGEADKPTKPVAKDMVFLLLPNLKICIFCLKQPLKYSLSFSPGTPAFFFF